MDVALRLEDVDHLAEEVIEVDELMVEVVESLELFFVESVHLPAGYEAILVEVDQFEPVVDGDVGGLVSLGQHEGDEVSVVHAVLLGRIQSSRHLLEYPLHDLLVQRVSVVTTQFLFRQQEVVIHVQFPEFAV